MRTAIFFTAGAQRAQKRFFTPRPRRRCGAFYYRQYTLNLFRKCARTLAVSCQFCYGAITTTPPDGSRCVPSPASAIRTPRLPLLPVWEQGARGMRGKGRGQRHAPTCHRPFQASGHPDSPFSPCGRRGQRKGARGMRGKSAQGLPGNAGHLLNHIITQTAQTPDCRSSVRSGSGAHRVRRARSTPVPPVPPVPPQTRHPSPCRSDHENGSCSPRRSTATP